MLLIVFAFFVVVVVGIAVVGVALGTRINRGSATAIEAWHSSQMLFFSY